MLKHLPVFIVLILFFGTANAQTHADSIKNLPADSIKKIVIVDTTSKKATVDTIRKKDTTKAHLKADTAIKSVAVIKPSSDSTVVDSVAKRSAIAKPLTDSIAKRPQADSSSMMKKPAAKKTVKHTATVKITPPPPDKIVKHSPIKTLSDMRYNAYLKGDDLDSMALVGEINHYPLPDHAIKYKVQIGLNPGQITKLKALATALKRKKIEMGENIIRNEKMLDSLFHSKQIIDGTLIFYTNRSGLYLGELRGAILMACYETEKILSDDQIRKLEALEKGN